MSLKQIKFFGRQKQIEQKKGNTVEPSNSNSTGETKNNLRYRGVDGTIQFATFKIDSW